MIVTKDNLAQHLETLLLRIVVPSNKYAVYFDDWTIEIPFIRCCQKLFTSELVMIRSTKFLEDIENLEKQRQLIS